MIQKILVAIDGSESAGNAVDFVLDLTEKYSAHLVLLNVFHKHIPFYYTSPVGDAFTLAGVEEYLNNQETRHKLMLEETLKNAKKRPKFLQKLTVFVDFGLKICIIVNKFNSRI